MKPQRMAKRSTGFIGSAAALLALGIALSGCVGPTPVPGRGSGWNRPDPTAIVDEYVDAAEVIGLEHRGDDERAEAGHGVVEDARQLGILRKGLERPAASRVAYG